MAAVLLCTGLPQSTVYAEQGIAERDITNEGNASQQISGQTEDGYQYRELKDGTLEIVRYIKSGKELIHPNPNEIDLVIPSEIEGKRVTSIGKAAFHELGNVNSVVIPEGVTQIGDYAFAYSGLISVTIPKTVKSIGENAFHFCSLKSVTLPKGLESIGKEAFFDSGLKSVTIPETVTSIGEGAFCNVEDNFSHGYWQEIIVDSNNATYTSKDGILYNKDMTALLQYPGGKKEFAIPEGITSIGAHAFRGCTNLKSITIPETIISIGAGAFRNTGLTTVTIPEGVTNIGEGAFHTCKEIVVDSNNTAYIVKDGVLYDKNMTILLQCFDTKTEFIIPEGVTRIGSLAFGKYYNDYRVDFTSNLTSVSLPETVTSIGEYAFGYCDQLTSINLPKGITSIGAGAFRGCEKLEQVVLPENLTCIEVATFGECIGLKSVVIPKKVTEIWEGAFSGCSNLESIEVAEDNPKYDSRNNCNAIIETDSDTLIVGCKNTEIPSGVIRIGDGAFFGWSIHPLLWSGYKVYGVRICG